MTTIHGESDHLAGTTAAQYEADLVEWQNNYETDVKAITGQTQSIPLFTDQMSSFTGYNSATSGIPIAQLSASVNNPGKIVLVAPKYFFNYSDLAHLTNTSYRWLGEYYGKVIKKVVLDGQSWKPLSPKQITLNGNIITAQFNVPAPPIVLDTSTVLSKTNYGFEYYDDASSTLISSVSILNSDTVQITLNQAPTGTNKRLRYAYTGTPGATPGGAISGSARGNLRDSDSTASLYGNTLYNWAVQFDSPITDITLNAPTSPTTSSVVTSSIIFSWTDNSNNETGFVVDKSTDGATFTNASTTAANVTSTIITGLTPNTAYWFRIAAFSGSATSTYATTSASAYTNSAAPTSLTVSNVSTSTLNLTWSANSNSASTIYYILYSSGATSSTIATSGTVTGLTPSTTYQFQVRAENLGSPGTYSAYSASSTATTTLDTLPTAPSAITTSTITSVSITVSWTDNSSNESHFSLDKSIDGSTYTNVTTTNANVTSVTVTSLTPNTAYWFRVAATNTIGVSSYVTTTVSTYTNASVPATSAASPPLLRNDNPPTISNVAVAASSTSAMITWNVNDDYGVSSSGLNYGRTASYYGSIGAVSGSYQSILTGLDPSMQYFYQIIGTDIAGQTTLYSDSFVTAAAVASVLPTPATSTSVFTTSTVQAATSTGATVITPPESGQTPAVVTLPPEASPVAVSRQQAKVNRFKFNAALKAGSSGANVEQLQTLLKELGFFTYSKITKFFGPVTKAAVVAYQKANNLAATGLLDDATRTSLQNESQNQVEAPATAAPSSPQFKNTLKLGSVGDEVKQLQTKLKALGFFTYPTVTGYFGTVTREAVIKFQKAKGLAPFPGLVGPATRAALNSL